MDLDQELLAILRCPKCKGVLQTEEASFVCEACQLRYPVVDGIPNFIIEDAQPLDGD